MSMVMSSPMRRRSIGSTFPTTLFMSSTRGCRICLRLNASSWRVSADARSAALRICFTSSLRGSVGIESLHDDLGIQPDHRQQIVEVVGDAAGESSDGVHLLRLAELLLEISPLGKVDGDGHESEHSPSLVANGRGREQSGEGLAGLSLHQEFARPGAAGRAALDDLRAVLAQEWRRGQLLNFLAYCFFSGPSVEQLGELVPEDHNAFRICRDDRLLHCVEQLRLESDRGFRPRSFRDVGHCSDHSHRGASAVARNVAAIHDVHVGVITAPVAVLVAPACSAVIDNSANAGDHALAVFRMDVIVQPLDLGVDLVLLVAEHGFSTESFHTSALVTMSQSQMTSVVARATNRKRSSVMRTARSALRWSVMSTTIATAATTFRRRQAQAPSSCE